MAYARFALVLVNATLYGVLFGLSVVYWRRDPSPRVRRLWTIVALVSGALILGGAQRLVLQASILGWTPGWVADFVTRDLQFAQSVVVGGLAVASFLTVKRVTASMATAERVAGSIIDRVSHVDPALLDLSKREREVLATIGHGLITDSELAQALHVHLPPVQTHVKNLLRKTGLKRRQDLIAVALLVESAH